MIGTLLMQIFHARTNAHVLHLKSRSYSQHKALNEFYEALVDHADGIAEVYQGKYGLIENYPARYTYESDPVSLVKGLTDWVEEHRYDCCDATDTCLQNMIDELLSLCASTVYKLKLLK